MAKKHLSEDEIKLIISGDSSKLQEELHTLTKETKANYYPVSYMV